MHQLISLQEARRASLKRRPPAAECFLAHGRKQDLLTTRSTTALWRNLLPFLGALMGRASLCYYSVREAACRRENWLSIDFFRTRANTGMLCSCKLCSWVSPKVAAVETGLLVISVISSTILSNSQLSRSENTCESAATWKVTTNSGDRCVCERAEQRAVLCRVDWFLTRLKQFALKNKLQCNFAIPNSKNQRFLNASRVTFVSLFSLNRRSMTWKK